MSAVSRFGLRLNALIAIASGLFVSFSAFANLVPMPCVYPNGIPQLLSGHSENTLVSTQPPFETMKLQKDVETIVWVTQDTSLHGLFTIQRPGNNKDVTVIATSCNQLSDSLIFALEAARKMVGPSQPLAPDAHFIDDTGFSFDQIVELHDIAFQNASKSQPDELYETLNELAGAIAAAPALSKSRSTSEKKYHIQTVYYGTTRKPVPDSDDYYGGARDTSSPLHYGEAKVSIPFNHKKGSIEQPFLSISWLKKANEHVLIQSVTEMKPGEFWDVLPVEKGSGEWKQSLIVYIHGYNVAFKSAIKRTAQMAYDFNYSGVPVLFSWPSNASLLDYASDREDAVWSATYLAEFLTKLKTSHPEANIHIVAHSMGNQVLLHALNELSLSDEGKTLRFGSVILAAPDVDSEWFKYQVGPRIGKLAANWAVYTSENDGALIASEKVNQAKRLGMPVSLVDNFDVIDTSELNAAPWSIPESHSYYANKLPVIEDLVNHLRGVPPKERALVRKQEDKGEYWQIVSTEE
ncbi:alpha/beta hydrolase [Vibrio sp. HN007]|uniref:alpha/beta hydrolase n=1 Tax=Vibrio iocasae TaxID=3098914 RepID=UPI0035D4AE20